MKLFLTITLLFVFHYLSAQVTQILPFTGIQYYENGIYAKSIEVELDDQTWTSNQLPSESSFKIKLNKPKGFTANEQENYLPNVRVTILDSEMDTVGHAEKFMGENAIFDKYSLDNLSLTLGFKPGTPFGKYLIKASFYDQLSTNSLDFNFNVELLEDVQPKPVTNSVNSFYSFKGYSIKTNGFGIEQIELGEIDSLTYSDKVTVPISFVGIEIPEGKFLNKDLYSLYYDSFSGSLQPIQTDIKSLSQISTKKISDTLTRIDVVIMIPKNLFKKGDFVEFRWDSQSKEHTLDCSLKLL